VSRLTLALLGGFAVTCDGLPVTGFESGQVRALLAYLGAAPGHTATRAHLADLLWPNHPEAAARANLRHGLSRLRHALADHDPARPLLRADARAIALDPAATISDVARFAALATTCAAHGHHRPERCAVCAPRLREAANLYRGALLAGPSLSRSLVFEEWLLATQAQLERQALEVFAALTRAAEDAADYQQLCYFARRQLELDPWREAAHRQLMFGLALVGDRGAALAQYRACHVMLASELGVEPDLETRALYERIRAGALAPAARSLTAPRHHLPAPLPPFVGRETELAALQADESGRLLTLTGAGGAGKTRLALEFARASLATYADGVCYVALAHLASVDAVAPAVATALALSSSGDMLAALLHFLADKHLLLVLDTFEHLLGGALLVTAILEAAPRVRVVATSQERLNLRGEHVYLVEGLRYEAGPNQGDALDVPAVRLFVQSVRRVQPTFALSDATLGPALEICRLLQGMPLGLELAAAWADRLPLAEIAAEIRRSSRFLEADWRDVPARQRSMHAVFEWSWQLLSAEEQRALCRLTIFRGGWTREAAAAVAGVPLQMLTRLVWKSLVRRSDLHGAPVRYEMLEPLWQLAAERIPAEARDDLAARHSAYYLGLVAGHEQRLARDEPHLAVAATQPELDNVRQAWAWVTTYAPLLDASLYELEELHLFRARLVLTVTQLVHRQDGAADEIQRILDGVGVISN